MEDGTYRYALGFDGTWPTLAGKPLCMSIADETESYILYNSPIIAQFFPMQMRIMVNYDKAAEEEDAEDSSETVQEEAAEENAEAIIEEEPEIHNETEGSPYKLLGFWDGYNAHTGLPGRNVMPLSSFAGTPITLCDAVYSSMLNKISEYMDSTETELTDDNKLNANLDPTYVVRG